jgi:4-amino-4-deoxy-L-arabinose transferase-like glycosyltransferase
VISEPPPPSASWRRDLLWLVLISGAAYFFLLGSSPLNNPDEGRYAEISREMAATGDWVTPRLDGIAYFEKPPLMYWAGAAMQDLFGPGEWAVRAVVALFSIAGIAVAYAAGRSLYGRGAGLWSAAVLGTSLLYFALGHLLLLDTAVSVLMSAALVCFVVGAGAPGGSRRRCLFLGFYAFAALATLTKGLIGFVLPGAVIFLWLLLFNQWRRLRPFFPFSGGLLFLAIAAPWHLMVAARNPTWAHFYFIQEHFQRFSTTEAHRVMAWWIFAPIVLIGLFPWTGFLWPAARDLLRGGWARRDENSRAWFLVTWAGFIFLFFTKSQSKLIPYILPVFPPLAVLIGAWISRRGRPPAAQAAGGHSEPLPLLVFISTSWLLAALAIVILIKPDLAFRSAEQEGVLRPWLMLLAAVTAAGGASAFLFKRHPTGRGAMGCILSTAALLSAVLVMAPHDVDHRGTRELALEARSLARPGDRIYHYHEFFHDFTFYSGRTVGLVRYGGELEPQNDDPARMAPLFITDEEFRRQWSGPDRILAVARKSEAKELFADPAFHYHILGEDPRHYLLSNR